MYGDDDVPSCGRTNFVHVFAKSPADRLQLPNDRILAPPQSNKVRVPTSRTRVMIGERRDRGAGPPAEEDVRSPGYSQMSWKTVDVLRRVPGPGARSGDGVARTRPRGSPDRSGQGAQTGASTKRASSPGDRRQIASRTDVPEALDARGRSFAKRMHSGASGGRSQTGLAGRARSTSGCEAVCRRGPRRARDRPGASRPRAHRSRGPRLTRD